MSSSSELRSRNQQPSPAEEVWLLIPSVRAGIPAAGAVVVAPDKRLDVSVAAVAVASGAGEENDDGDEEEEEAK